MSLFLATMSQIIRQQKYKTASIACFTVQSFSAILNDCSCREYVYVCSKRLHSCWSLVVLVGVEARLRPFGQLNLSWCLRSREWVVYLMGACVHLLQMAGIVHSVQLSKCHLVDITELKARIVL